LQRAVQGPRIANLSTFSLDRVEASESKLAMAAASFACRRSSFDNLLADVGESCVHDGSQVVRH